MLAAAAATVLLVSIAALIGLFLHTMDAASAFYDRTAFSRTQLAEMGAAQSAMRSGDLPAARAALSRYAAAAAAERRLLHGNALRTQSLELDHAAAMLRLTTGPGAYGAMLARQVAAAARRERAEALETTRALANLRRQTRVYAMLLAATAALAALLGAAGLGMANRRLSRAVADRTRQLIAIDRSRRLFFAKVSHELRTPVTVMRGEAEVALATASHDPDALTAALTDIIAQSEQMDHRIADLLALSQAEDGQLTLMRVRCDLSTIVERAMMRGRRYAVSNEVALIADALPSVSVTGDARWLEQMLVALIDNAIKFSHRGGEVGVAVMREAAEVVLTVTDRGIGALPAAMPRLFDAYYQTADGQARGGSGLGLAMVRWVAEYHGGRAAAAARPGGGCVVAITLPVAA